MLKMMRFCVLISLMCVVNAAPYYEDFYSRPHYHESLHYPRESSFDNKFFQDGMFDTGRFWKDLESDLKELDEYLNEFHRRFSSSGIDNSDGYKNGQYKLTFRMSGFEEDDFKVSAKKNLLMIQAMHNATENEDTSKMVTVLRKLPEDVDPKGTWTYDGESLSIVFTVKTEVSGESTEASVSVNSSDESTVKPVSREEMESSNDEKIVDADVGVVNSKKEEVESTTYAVDIDNEIDFVPIS